MFLFARIVRLIKRCCIAICRYVRDTGNIYPRDDNNPANSIGRTQLITAINQPLKDPVCFVVPIPVWTELNAMVN